MDNFSSQMEHNDYGFAQAMEIDIAEQKFQDDYLALRGRWHGRWGKPGHLPEATWLQLWREQQDRLAAAPAAAAEDAEEATKAKSRTTKKLQPA